MSASANPYYSIRAIATRHKISTAVVAGVVSTHLATIWGFWLHGIGLPDLDFNSLNGQEVLPKASPTTQFFTGAVAHYTTGICFALIFAFVIHVFLPWRNTIVGNVTKALLWGLVLAIGSVTFMLPRVYYPHGHLGFFSHNLGFKMVFAVFVWHAIYGLVLGLIYSPLPDDEVIESQTEIQKVGVNGYASDSALRTSELVH